MTAHLITRRVLIATAAGSTLLPMVPATASTPSLNFVQIGDWGRQGSDKQREVGSQMGRTAEAIGSRFVISVGDNFYEDGVTGVDDPQWATSFEAIYPAASLQTPWHVILGNHDYRGNVAAQLAYSSRSPRWHMPARYFKTSETLADGTSADFFYIDTNPFLSMYRGTKVDISGQDTGAQLLWLDAALGASTAKWKILIGHHPLYTVNGGKRDQPELIGPIKPLMQKHGVKIYVNGHDHNFQYLQVDGLYFITSGAGSQTEQGKPASPGQFTSASHGFMAVALSADQFDFRFIDDAGLELFGGQVPA